jgi:hypothetical protein
LHCRSNVMVNDAPELVELADTVADRVEFPLEPVVEVELGKLFDSILSWRAKTACPGCR